MRRINVTYSQLRRRITITTQQLPNCCTTPHNCYTIPPIKHFFCKKFAYIQNLLYLCSRFWKSCDESSYSIAANVWYKREITKHEGEMAEWSIAAVLKTVELRGSGGSNPSLSAKKEK